MLENLDLTLKLSKAQYRQELDRLREELRDLQQSARRARVPVVVVFEGWDAAGKGDSIATLVYPLDPRGFKVHTTQAPSAEEQLRPFLARFWTRLPAKGDFALFDRSWYRRLLEDRLDGNRKPSITAAEAAEIRDFERQLTEEGHVVVKLWLHISRPERKRRLKRIKADHYEQWRAAQKEWRRRPGYKRYLAAANEMIETTSTLNAPWTLVEANDSRFRRIKVLTTLVTALRAALETAAHKNGDEVDASAASREDAGAKSKRRRLRAAVHVPSSNGTLLDRVDLGKKLTRAEYDSRLDTLQGRLRDLAFGCYRARLPVVIVYEGWDASGKGGNIKRLTQEIDPRGYEVIPIAAPNAAEREHHYLWRFWKQLPKSGHIGVFDRSWYGRVLVERVEGFAREEQWRRAYREINDFERELGEFGAVIVKFWLHLSPEEQLRRFRARERTAYKQYKIGDEDWRNRARWNDYHAAVVEMIERTSTTYAPWTIVEAENKLWARIRTLSVVVKALEQRLK